MTEKTEMLPHAYTVELPRDAQANNKHSQAQLIVLTTTAHRQCGLVRAIKTASTWI